jgi:hypothetical protein
MTSEELIREIGEITINADVEPDVIFTALQAVLAFWMSYLCGNCRHDVAHQFKVNVAKMLAVADANRHA